jgi:ribosomal protein L29
MKNKKEREENKEVEELEEIKPSESKNVEFEGDKKVDLLEVLKEYSRAVHFYKIQNKMHNLVQVHQIKKIKKEIARLLTSINSSFEKKSKFHFNNLLNLKSKKNNKLNETNGTKEKN